tara:strand:- start:74237 stop:76288 length:2052 start_codon:yes stop_codon:yes gene_type:complete
LTIKTAYIEFNADGTPLATDFGDIYFSAAGGAAEAEHVFILNNQLLERWSHWSKNTFVIAETGFGTGLNFLVTLTAFSQFIKQNPNSHFSLHFVSTEKFPLNRKDLVQALGAFVQFNDLANELITQYPMPLTGCHRMTFCNNRVILDLWLGDIHDSLPQIYVAQKGLVDAWFLDGFAPSKNPQMWTQALFEQMARLACNDCTFSTFTAAGFVKRGLRDVGFTVEKRKGHGRKREMLAGHITSQNSQRQQAKYYHRSPYSGAISNSVKSDKKPTVAIIGAGIAGATAAYALAQRGFQCDVYFNDASPAQGASGNPQAGFYPQLNVDASHSSQINAHSFVYASGVYRKLLAGGYNFAHQWCGVLQLGFKPALAARYAKLIDNNIWPEDLVRYVDSQQAQQISQCDMPYSGLFMPLGGWIDPAQLVKALFSAAGDLSQTTLHNNQTLTGLERHNKQWQLNFDCLADNAHNKQCQANADIVIYATGAQSQNVTDLRDFPLRMVRGQVEAIPAQPALANLNTVLCHKGYLTPEYQGQHALGSTYVKDDVATDYRLEEQTKNLATHYQSLEKCPWAQNVEGKGAGRAAVRCSSPDHLPLVGALADITQQKRELVDLYKAFPQAQYPQGSDLPNLFMLTGLGSRGLTTAPLMAELLASQINGQPLPLPNDLLNTLNPNRFLIRQLIRREI